MKFLVERESGKIEAVNADSIGLSATTLFFTNSEGKVVKTFNNVGGWLSVSEAE